MEKRVSRRGSGTADSEIHFRQRTKCSGQRVVVVAGRRKFAVVFPLELCLIWRSSHCCTQRLCAAKSCAHCTTALDNIDAACSLASAFVTCTKLLPPPAPLPHFPKFSLAQGLLVKLFRLQSSDAAAKPCLWLVEVSGQIGCHQFADEVMSMGRTNSFPSLLDTWRVRLKSANCFGVQASAYVSNKASLS